MNNDKILKDFLAKDKAAELGGGTRKIEKQHQAGRMTARERIETLLDKGTFVEFDKFVTHRCTNYHMQQEKIPGDGIVSGYGKVDGRPVYVYAYDFTVFGGSLSLTNAGKIVKVQTMALKNGAPIIALNDSGGARIQEGVDSLTGYANIFFQNTIASGVIPQISAILGPCAGGACYSPALTDFIFMVNEKSHMFVTGPDVVKAVTHEEVSKEELGGAYTHNSKSGVAHFLGNSEEEVLMGIRELLSFLPSNNLEDAPARPTVDDVRREDERLTDLIPSDPNVPYDVKELIESVADDNYFYEIMPHFAKNVVIHFWPGCSISTHRTRRPGSSVFATVSISRSSRWKTSPGSFPAVRRNTTASSATERKSFTPTSKPPCRKSRSFFAKLMAEPTSSCRANRPVRT